jgi:hypothetical protein
MRLPWFADFVEFTGPLMFGGAIAKFFAATSYVAWLAPRVPDPVLRESARRLRWLGPCLTVFLSCFYFSGYVISLAMYFAMFNRLRRGLRDLREEQGTPGATLSSDTSRPVS